MPGPAFDIVLFDLGDVLMDPGGVAPMRQLARIETDDELWERWLTFRWVRSFERGHCGADEFASGIVGDWELDITPGDFLRAFAQWPKGPYPGAPDLVAAVRQVTSVGCLSNTNVVHWDVNVIRFPFVNGFEHRFLSYELGMVKPDREIFEEVANRLQVPGHRILFLDDNTLNVDAAQAAGFTSLRAQGIEEARQAVVDAGIIER